MTTFVLVHGAWHGGWCWAECETFLRELGHQTHALTLTGLGERSHLARVDIDADLHVKDVINTFHWRELTDVILVGHSYGGMVITGVAGHIPERIRALVYLDAMVPEKSGVSLFAQANPQRMASFQAKIEQGATALEPDLFDAWTNDPVKKDWLKKMTTPHPIGCFQKGVTLTGRESEVSQKHYIIATRNKPSAFWEQYNKVKTRPGWTTSTIDTKHDAMVEAPEVLAKQLDAIAKFN
jgi:pimeloyl-ACP methyl ester carboxylesterase